MQNIAVSKKVLYSTFLVNRKNTSETADCYRKNKQNCINKTYRLVINAEKMEN